VTSIGVPGLFNLRDEDIFTPVIAVGVNPPNDPMYVLGHPTSNF
jgi:hypothetical protein